MSRGATEGEGRAAEGGKAFEWRPGGRLVDQRAHVRAVGTYVDLAQALVWLAKREIPLCRFLDLLARKAAMQMRDVTRELDSERRCLELCISGCCRNGKVDEALAHGPLYNKLDIVV